MADGFPGDEDRQHNDQGGEQKKEHTDAVDAQGIVDIERRDPGVHLPELHDIGAFIKQQHDRQAEKKLDQADNQGHDLDGRGLLPGDDQQRESAEDREKDQGAEERYGHRDAS